MELAVDPSFEFEKSTMIAKFSISADQNVTRTLRRRRTHARQNGQKLSESPLARSWLLIQALSLRREEMFQSSTTGSCGKILSMPCRELKKSKIRGRLITFSRE